MEKRKVLSLFLFCSVVFSLHAQMPVLTQREVQQGWMLLFDGKSFEGWQKANGQPFTGKGWKIENGVLSVDPTTGRGGDIVTTQKFSDFELSLDFKLEKGSNSGVKYNLFENTSLGSEYQIIDDGHHPDAQLGKDGNRTLAAHYDVLPPAGNKKVKAVGAWNNLRIIVKGKNVEHWLNGVKVLEFNRDSERFQKGVAESKFKNQKDFAAPRQSPILLQEHEDVIHFRNIKIRIL